MVSSRLNPSEGTIMNRGISCLAISLGVLLVFACPSAFARKAKAGKPGSEMHLVSIDLPNNKITVSDPSGKDINTLTVMQVTKVTINGQPAKLSDLRRGMHVLLSVSQGGKVADKIDVTTATPPKTAN
jgi:hypothetical protein